MKLARMRTCGGGGTRETAVVGSLLLCCTCARGLRMPPCLSCSWKFPLSAEIAPCVAGVEIRGRARRPALSRCHAHASVKTCIERERREREKEHRPPSSAPRSVRSLGDVRGEDGGGKAGSGREERHEERAGEKEEARQGAARSRWGAPSCRAGFGVSASFIVGFVRVVIVGQEWLRQVQQSSRTRGTDSIGDAICLMVLQLLGSNLESGDRARE